MTLETPTIVIFDMDGTTVRHVNPRLLGMLEWLDDLSFKIGSFFFNRDYSDAQLKDKTGSTPSLLVHRAIHTFRRRPVEQIVQPCPGIYTMLNTLKSAGIPIGIVSNGLGRGYGHDILEKFHLADYFTIKIFREDIKNSKPHPEPILRALKSIKEPLGPHDIVWYIGDRHKDVLAAIAAQDHVKPATVIPFAYGLNASVAILEKNIGPDHIIMNYHDFVLRLRERLKAKAA